MSKDEAGSLTTRRSSDECRERGTEELSESALPASMLCAWGIKREAVDLWEGPAKFNAFAASWSS